MKRQVKASAKGKRSGPSLGQGVRLAVAAVVLSAWVAAVLYWRLGGSLTVWGAVGVLPGLVLAYLFDRSTVARVIIPMAVAGSLWKNTPGDRLLELGALLWLVGGGVTTFLVLVERASYILPVLSATGKRENLRLLLRFLARDLWPLPTISVLPDKLPDSLKSLGLVILPSHLALAVRKGREVESAGPGLVQLPPGAEVLGRFDLRLHEQHAEGIKATTRDGIPIQTSLTLTFYLRRSERPEQSVHPFPYDELAIAEAFYATTVKEANQEYQWQARVRPRAIAYLVDALSRHTLNELYALGQREQEPLRDMGQNIRVMLEDDFLHQGVEIKSVMIGRLIIPESALSRRWEQWKEAWNAAIKERHTGIQSRGQSWSRPAARRPIRHATLALSPSVKPLSVVSADSFLQRLLTAGVVAAAFTVYLLVARAIEQTDLTGIPLWLQTALQDYPLFAGFITPILTFLAGVFNWHVLRHLIPLAAGWWVGQYLAAHVLQGLYDLPDSKTANDYLQHLHHGTAKKVLLNREKLEAERPGQPLLRLGGPGIIIVPEGNVAVTEINGGFCRVLGNGEHKLSRFEYVRSVLDLREQQREQQAAVITTREGIEIKTDIHVLFRISQGDQSPGRTNPFPFDPESARRAAYAERVREDGSVALWDTYPLDKTVGALTTLAARLLLDEIIDPNRQYGPGFDPHISLQDGAFEAAAHELRDIGIQLLSVDIRALELPEPIQETLVRYWQTFPDPLQTSGPGGSDQARLSTWGARPTDGSRASTSGQV